MHSLKDLEIRARAGDAEAQIALGRECEARQDAQGARGWFAQAAKAGSVPAIRMLAMNLLTEEPIADRHGVAMIHAAAEKGDAEAEHVRGLLAAQDSLLERRWEIALGHVGRAAEAGLPVAQATLQFLADTKDLAVEAVPEGTWRKFRARIDPDAFLQPSTPQILSESPRIVTFERFISPAICDWLIERARPRIRRAIVAHPETAKGYVEGARTNGSADFGLVHSDLVLMLVRERIAKAAGMPLESLESAAVLHYAPGEEFITHYDAFDTSLPAFAQEVAARGQRVATFLIYLNEGFEGGETAFPLLGLSFKGRPGDAILFWNVDASGGRDLRMQHAGTPPKTGEKWLFSQWLRRRSSAAPR